MPRTQKCVHTHTHTHARTHAHTHTHTHTETQKHRQTDRQTDRHEYSIVAVDKKQLDLYSIKVYTGQ